MLVRNDFLVFELHSEKNTFSPECGSNFENCSFRLVPFTFRLSVTGPLTTDQITCDIMSMSHAAQFRVRTQTNGTRSTDASDDINAQ